MRQTYFSLACLLKTQIRWGQSGIWGQNNSRVLGNCPSALWGGNELSLSASLVVESSGTMDCHLKLLVFETLCFQY